MPEKQYIDHFIQGETIKYLRDDEAVHHAELVEAVLEEFERYIQDTGFSGRWVEVVQVIEPEESIDITFDEAYVYSMADCFDIYLNGLHLTPAEYSTTGSANVLTLTLSQPTFTGTVEVVVTKLRQ